MACCNSSSAVIKGSTCQKDVQGLRAGVRDHASVDTEPLTEKSEKVGGRFRLLGPVHAPPLLRPDERPSPYSEPLALRLPLFRLVIAIGNGQPLADQRGSHIAISRRSATYELAPITIRLATPTGESFRRRDVSKPRSRGSSAIPDGIRLPAGLPGLWCIDTLKPQAIMAERKRISIDDEKAPGKLRFMLSLELRHDQQAKRQHAETNDKIPENTPRTLHISAHFKNETFAIMANKTFSDSIFLRNDY
nr:hypothetical protein [Rhizobium sp. ACO-34A]